MKNLLLIFAVFTLACQNTQVDKLPETIDKPASEVSKSVLNQLSSQPAYYKIDDGASVEGETSTVTIHKLGQAQDCQYYNVSIYFDNRIVELQNIERLTQSGTFNYYKQFTWNNLEFWHIEQNTPNLIWGALWEVTFKSVGDCPTSTGLLFGSARCDNVVIDDEDGTWTVYCPRPWAEK